MGEVISVFEYDLLGSGKAASVGAKVIPQQVFEYLEALSLTSIQEASFSNSLPAQVSNCFSAKLRGDAFNTSRFPA
jgi:hypothetical protein